jgi:hypothetical protein
VIVIDELIYALDTCPIDNMMIVTIRPKDVASPNMVVLPSASLFTMVVVAIPSINNLPPYLLIHCFKICFISQHTIKKPFIATYLTCGVEATIGRVNSEIIY